MCQTELPPLPQLPHVCGLVALLYSATSPGSRELAVLVLETSPAEVAVDERIEIAVEDALDIADLHIGAQVLDHLIRLHHVAADLPAPGGFALLTADLIDLRQTFDVEPARGGAPSGSPSPGSDSAAGCARSGTATTIPVGKWVMRTAESVLFTC